MTAAHVLEQLTPNVDLASVLDSIGLGGLLSADGRAFPLESLKVRTSIAGPCARSVIEQRFSNPSSEILDATWTFPLPGDGALVSLELRAGDVVVIGECQKRADALATFEQARAEGKRTALVETEQRGVHTLSIAGLPPRSEVVVKLTVVELLAISDSRFRWQFPTTIAPRYTPGNAWSHTGFGVTPDTDAVPNASRLTPPLRLAGGTVLDLEVEIAGPLSSLESSLHAVRMSLDSGHVRVAPSGVTTMNRDFILEFSTADASSVASRAYTDGQFTVAIVEAPADVDARALPRDAVFVVDISGSMEGDKLTAAKAALVGALHGLQDGDRFKLFAFDDRVERFRTEFVDYNEKNQRAADQWIASLNSRGGTEMLEAIQQSLLGDTPAGRLRTVLFITDGQSNDEARLLPAVANRRGNAVFFTLGIDTAVNASLLKLLAKAGGGACELCTPSDDIDAVVAKLETRFGSPLLSDVQTSGSARPDGQTVFSGRPAALLIEGSPESVSISATSPGGAFNTTIVPSRIDFSLGALWARERVSYLEERITLRPFEEEAIKPEIERIALAHKIGSKFTSFVCVDHTVRSHGERRHVVQSVEYPAQWEEGAVGGAFGAAPGGAMPSQMPMSAPSFVARAQAAMPAPAPMPAPRSRKMSARHEDMARFEEMAPESDAYASESLDTASTGSFSLREALGSLLSSKKDSSDDPGSDDFEGLLARTQNANGSYGDDVGRSAAALLAFILLGSTRRKGNRRRSVKKLAQWLEQHRRDSSASLALAALENAESTGDTSSKSDWRALTNEGAEGGILAQLM